MRNGGRGAHTLRGSRPRRASAPLGGPAGSCRDRPWWYFGAGGAKRRNLCGVGTNQAAGGEITAPGGASVMAGVALTPRHVEAETGSRGVPSALIVAGLGLGLRWLPGSCHVRQPEDKMEA